MKSVKYNRWLKRTSYQAVRFGFLFLVVSLVNAYPYTIQPGSGDEIIAPYPYQSSPLLFEDESETKETDDHQLSLSTWIKWNIIPDSVNINFCYCTTHHQLLPQISLFEQFHSLLI